MSSPLAPYVGNAAYCYAHSASMLLASIGESVDPALIECLSAVGAGARLWRDDGVIYFSNRPPDVGLSGALQALGFAFHEQACKADAAFPVDVLKSELEKGPVLIGPLDMQHLTYLPGHASLEGVDHFVLLTAFEPPDHVRLHDPKGYPNVRLSLGDLEAAWRASAVSYARGAFRFWARPERTESIDGKDLPGRCIAAYRAAYDWPSAHPDNRVVIGREAFEAAAERLAEDGAEALIAMLLAFGLPLGARRAHDLAILLASSDELLSGIKQAQALAFMDGYRQLMDGDRLAAGDAIRRIGDLDDDFRAALTRK